MSALSPHEKVMITFFCSRGVGTSSCLGFSSKTSSGKLCDILRIKLVKSLDDVKHIIVRKTEIYSMF